ncbi:lipocalin-like domain-containing protein [Cellulophaga omnivescoria]|uniref:lipocalin family protein n=1 Tax=Cellulophaga omnivescoria TaxID=1888890 RepID=UPI0022F013B6|nr:lipocalin family protein [Cellulophaga omnivescoria]WBU87898.1 lipocalin family protein [Cellulophaga omnivescoria]
MKKLNTLATLFLALAFFSCSSDDNSEDEKDDIKLDYSEMIVGEWNFKSQAVNGVDEEYPDECHKEFEYQIYEENGSYKQTEFENHSGNGCEEVTPTAGSWDIDENNNLLLTINDVVYTVTITKLNQTVMEWELEIDYDEDGTIDIYTQVLTRRN